MLKIPDDILIFRVDQQEFVEAKLVRLDRETAKTQIDGTWWNIPVSKTLRVSEGDHHWCWRKLVGESRNYTNWETLAIQRTNGAIEGAMRYRIDAKSQLTRNHTLSKGAVRFTLTGLRQLPEIGLGW